MSINVQKVHPGDLITATFFNGIVDALNMLQAEIDAIGTVGSPPSAAKPVITSTEPANVPAGTTLTIHGHNFEVPAVLNTITLDGTPLASFVGGSTDQLLNVVVPGDISGSLPKTMTLVLTTTGGEATANVHVVSQVVTLTGAAVIRNTSGELPAANEGETINFKFTIDGGDLNKNERYRLHAEFANLGGDATAKDWQDGTTFVGVNHDDTVDVTPTQIANVGADVVIPAGARSVDMTVWAISLHNDPTSSSNHLAVPITVGQAGPPADPSIHLSFGTNASPFVHGQTYTGTVSGTGLAVKYGSNPVVEVLVGADNAGTYTIEGAVENADSTMWAVTGLPKSLKFSTGQPGQSVHFNLHLVPTAVNGDVTRFFTLTATRQEDDSVGQISNFFRFPIGGF